MVQPSRALVHIDRPLTDFTLGFLQDTGNFIADMVCPTLPVDKQSDKYFKFDPAAFMRADMQLRVSGTESKGTGFTLSNDTYYCEKYAVHFPIDYDTLANADDEVELEKNAARLLAQNVLLKKEKLFATAAWNTGIWTGDVLGSATYKWDDYTNSDPIRVIDQGKKVVRNRATVEPNVLILGEDVYLALKEHPDLVNRLQYTDPSILTEAKIASMLGVERVVVAKAIQNTANEGLAASLSNIVSAKSALLLHRPSKLGLFTPSSLVNFAWKGAPDLPRFNGVVTRVFDKPEKQARIIETEMTCAFKVTCADLGVFYSAIVA
jgi:hypothetical protein